MTLTASLDDLRAAILASPRDDALRQVYADHLIERADPRGLLIACQLARDVPEDQRVHLASRAHRLERLHAGQLCHETGALDARYERGFLHTLAMRAADFATHGPRLLSEEPIERLTLYLTPDVDHPTLARLVDLPGLERVRDLALHASDAPPTSATPAAPPAPPAPTAPPAPATPGAPPAPPAPPAPATPGAPPAASADRLEAFVHASRLRHLHTLELGTAHLELSALAAWPHEDLELLILVGALDESAVHYARSPHLRSLRWLYTDAESAAMIDAVVGALPALTHLAFSSTPEALSPRTRGFRRAPSPRAISRETRRITEHVRGSWDLWLRTDQAS